MSNRDRARRAAEHRGRRGRVRLVPYIHVDAAVAFLAAEKQEEGG